MLNRRHLRIKVLQALYAFYRSDGKDYSNGEKELFFGINKIYEMYLFYLLLFGELLSFAEFRIEENKKKAFMRKFILKNGMKKIFLFLIGKVKYDIVKSHFLAVKHFHFWNEIRYKDNGYNPFS